MSIAGSACFKIMIDVASTVLVGHSPQQTVQGEWKGRGYLQILQLVVIVPKGPSADDGIPCVALAVVLTWPSAELLIRSYVALYPTQSHAFVIELVWRRFNDRVVDFC